MRTLTLTLILFPPLFLWCIPGTARPITLPYLFTLPVSNPNRNRNNNPQPNPNFPPTNASAAQVQSLGAMAVHHASFGFVSSRASSEYLDRVFVDMMWYKVR